MSQPKSIPLWHSGRNTVAGVEARPAPGHDPKGESVLWLVSAATLGELRPKPGDRCKGADGLWWTVEAVGKLADGAYPCKCRQDPKPPDAAEGGDK